jgi:chromosome segregation ATPase
MQFRKAAVSFLALVIVACFSVGASAHQRKPRPTKYPQQLPQIIGDENARPDSAQPAPQGNTNNTDAAGLNLTPQQNDSLIRAVEVLSGEVRSLVQEMRALNARQQAQLDILRLTRADLRIDQYERELKATRDRLVQVGNDEQQLQFALKPESLEAQMRTVPTLNRDATMQQIKESYEARLRAVVAEKEMLQRREAEISGALKGYQDAIGDTERRLQAVEDSLKPPGSTEQPGKDKPER